MSQLEMSEQDEDEIMSSYVIEVNPDYGEGSAEEENAVHEAIAWAKEKFQGHCSENNLSFEEEKQQSGVIEGAMKDYFSLFQIYSLLNSR